MDLARGHGHEVPSTDGDAIDPDRIVAPVPGRDEVDQSAAEAKALSEVDVVQVAVGSVLDLTSAQGVHGNPALLVRADDRASSPANRGNPDRRVVGCVATVWDGLRLHLREDDLYSRLPAFSMLLGAPTQSCSPCAQEKGKPEGARNSRRPDSQPSLAAREAQFRADAAMRTASGARVQPKFGPMTVIRYRRPRQAGRMDTEK